MPAAAQDIPPRCAILGQMAVSSWLEMLRELDATQDSVIYRSCRGSITRRASMPPLAAMLPPLRQP